MESLLCKHKDPSLDPYTHIKGLAWPRVPVTPSLGVCKGAGSLLRLADCQFSQESKLKKMMKF